MPTQNRSQKRAIKKVLRKKKEPVIVGEVETEDGVIRFAKADTIMTLKDLELIGNIEDENADSGQVVALLRALCADQESRDILATVSLDQLEDLMEILDEVLAVEDEESHPKG